MGEIICVALVFTLGIFIGSSSIQMNISDKQIMEAKTQCISNHDLLKITINDRHLTAYCTNGATFQLKDK